NPSSAEHLLLKKVIDQTETSIPQLSKEQTEISREVTKPHSIRHDALRSESRTASFSKNTVIRHDIKKKIATEIASTTAINDLSNPLLPQLGRQANPAMKRVHQAVSAVSGRSGRIEKRGSDTYKLELELDQVAAPAEELLKAKPSLQKNGKFISDKDTVNRQRNARLNRLRVLKMQFDATRMIKPDPAAVLLKVMHKLGLDGVQKAMILSRLSLSESELLDPKAIEKKILWMLKQIQASDPNSLSDAAESDPKVPTMIQYGEEF
ncbi:MAG: hypothetical protein GX589_03025, partial [Deltaproteobacteria bacterium]|nr:hypothetical protein [Deltaproteobacteria bacterium]